MIRQLLCISGSLLLAVGIAVRADAQEAAAAPRPADRSAEPGVTTSPPVPNEEPAVSTSGRTSEAPGSARAATGTPRRFKTVDRLELDASAITGNQELPKVLYIVPWKKADLGDIAGRPSNSLLDEVLTPVDRDVFRRQTEYFSKLEESAAAHAGQRQAEQAQGNQGEAAQQGQQQPEQK